MLFPGASRFMDARMQFLELLRFLNDRDVEIDYIIHIASPYLPRTERALRRFLEICFRLEVRGYLGPDNLNILQYFFYNDTIALRKICETENAIKGK